MLGVARSAPVFVRDAAGAIFVPDSFPHGIFSCVDCYFGLLAIFLQPRRRGYGFAPSWGAAAASICGSRFARGTELIRNPSESFLETCSFLSRLDSYHKSNRILSGCFLLLLFAHYGLSKFSIEIHQNPHWKHPADNKFPDLFV